MNRRSLFVQLACIWEATARKPGNVHRYADFADVRYLDFLTSAAAIAPILGTADQRPLGETILQAVQATRQVAPTNTNLGIILLLAPLCSAPEAEDVLSTIPKILEQTTVEDSRKVYEAIRLAQPGGMGKVQEQDVAEEPALSLIEIMKLAAGRDMIARQYVNSFRDVGAGRDVLCAGIARFGALEQAVIHCHLSLLATYPDSLIARKCGAEEANEVQRRAQELFAGEWDKDPQRPEKIATFDNYLRRDAHRRNPGTTADLVTASLFVALREGKIALPLRLAWA